MIKIALADVLNTTYDYECTILGTAWWDGVGRGGCESSMGFARRTNMWLCFDTLYLKCGDLLFD